MFWILFLFCFSIAYCNGIGETEDELLFAQIVSDVIWLVECTEKAILSNFQYIN